MSNKKSLTVLDARTSLTATEMISEFQCPGCVNGCDTNTCSQFKLEETTSNGAACVNHCPGTRMLGFGRLALGLPKGFNRYGMYAKTQTAKLEDAVDGQMGIRFWARAAPKFDKFNVPVWRYEKDGFLFVRTFIPRVNGSVVDVIQLNGKKGSEIAERALDAGEFYEEYD